MARIGENGKIPMVLILMVPGCRPPAGRTTSPTSRSGLRGQRARMAAQGRRGRGAAARRRDELVGLGVTEIVDHYDEIHPGARANRRDRSATRSAVSSPSSCSTAGSGARASLIDPAPPKGCSASTRPTLKSAGPALGHPSKKHGVVTLTEEQFHYAFTNGWPDEAAHAAYRAVSGARDRPDLLRGRLRELPPALAHRARLEARGSRPAPARRRRRDTRSPLGTVKSNFKKYKHSAARTDYIEFPAGPTSTWPRRAGKKSQARSTVGSTASSMRLSRERSTYDLPPTESEPESELIGSR